jgi:hypothetical protein
MLTRERIQTLIIGIVLCALAVGNVAATHHYLTEPHPGHNDFMSRWEGARSFWRDGLNPYGEKASQNIQQQIYGRAARANEDPGFFAYPFYTVFLIWPLVYTSYAWASAIWMVLLEACLIGALLLLLDLFRWRPPTWLLSLLFLWTLVYYFSARGLLLGQPGLLVYFFEVLTLWALAKRHDQLAGFALALSTIKPQMGFLVVPFLLLWGWRIGCWKFIGSFALVWGGLMLLSFVMVPSWFGDWIEQLRNYPSYTALGAPVWIVMDYYLGLGTVGEWVINALLYGLLLWAWYHVLVRQEMARLDWTIMLTLTITHLAAVRTATPHYVIFTIPLLFYFWLFPRRSSLSALSISLILLLLLVIPWLHFLTTVDGEFEHPTIYLPLPLIMLVLLWLTRRWWWVTPSFVSTGT